MPFKARGPVIMNTFIRQNKQKKKYIKKGETNIYKDKSIKTYHYNYNVSTNYKCRALN